MGLVSRIRSASLRNGLVMLVVAAMMFRGAIPVNYMAEHDAETGSIIIRMCGGGAERFVQLDLTTGKIGEITEDTGDEPAQSDDDACPYALSQVFDLPRTQEHDPAVLFGPPLLGGQPVFDDAARALARPPLPPRGPPHLSL